VAFVVIYLIRVITIIYVLSRLVRFDSGRRINVDRRGASTLFKRSGAFVNRAIAVV
jgi:hypothetical protein